MMRVRSILSVKKTYVAAKGNAVLIQEIGLED